MNGNQIYINDNFKFFNPKNFIRNLTIIMIHGFMGSSKIWTPIYKILCKKFRIILIDVPGHGYSVCFKKNNILTMEYIADTIIKYVLKKNNINNAIFIGHSMGGYISLAIAEKVPKLFLGLCLVHSTAKSDNVQKRKNRINSIKLIKNNYNNFVIKTVDKWFNPNNIHLLKDEIDFTKKIALLNSSDGIISTLIGIALRKERSFILKKYSFPKLYITGTYDLILNKEEIYREVDKGINTNIIEIPTGHMGHLELPKKVTTILEKFIKSI
ncbi:alpha/beta fold hydrolase [Blattabacterium cuenoti]|uniref:alpha/beta fold hydrolase n=1 Tax=Blattabacterium cuenoti TaxID=1653831 RepID=UPI00163BB3CB|nr:alpha/beta hydrolase [Blattabacterium cuenoti]